MARKRKERNDDPIDTLLGCAISFGVIILLSMLFIFILAKCSVVTSTCEEQKVKQEVTSILNIHN